VFKLLQPLDVRGLQPAVFGSPLIIGGGTDAVLPPDLVDGDVFPENDGRLELE
jgi:hypothetical protein